MELSKKTELPENFELPEMRGFELTEKRIKKDPSPLANPYL